MGENPLPPETKKQQTGKDQIFIFPHKISSFLTSVWREIRGSHTRLMIARAPALSLPAVNSLRADIHSEASRSASRVALEHKKGVNSLFISSVLRGGVVWSSATVRSPRSRACAVRKPVIS